MYSSDVYGILDIMSKEELSEQAIFLENAKALLYTVWSEENPFDFLNIKMIQFKFEMPITL